MSDQKTQWSAWTRTFLWWPEKTVTGKYAIGCAWTRTRDNCLVYENEDEIGFYIDDVTEEYAQHKMELFQSMLEGEANDNTGD